MLYSIDKWGRVHFGRNLAEAFRKVREAEGVSSDLDDVLEVGVVEAGLKLRKLKQGKKKKN